MPPTASSTRRVVSVGFYGVASADGTYVDEAPCDIGEACSGGLKSACGDSSKFCRNGQRYDTQCGYYTTSDQGSEKACSQGHYCVGGVASLCDAGTFSDEQLATVCKNCFPGRYGNTSGETSSMCTGLCKSGYLCPSGSTSATQLTAAFPVEELLISAPGGEPIDPPITVTVIGHEPDQGDGSPVTCIAEGVDRDVFVTQGEVTIADFNQATPFHAQMSISGVPGKTVNIKVDCSRGSENMQLNFKAKLLPVSVALN